MQKVERKQHRERKHRRLIWLAAAFVLLAGSVTAAVLLNRKSEEFPAREDHSGTLISRQTDELVSVTVKRRGENAWRMIRSNDGTLVPEDGEWTAEEQLGIQLQEAITQLQYQEVLTEDPAEWDGTEDFGLSEPLVTITAQFTDGTETTVYIGNETGLDDGSYYLATEGDGRLFAVSGGLVQDVNLEYALLRPVPRPEIYAALLDRITVADRDGSVIAEWMLQGQIADRDAGTNWSVTAPFIFPADEESIRNLKKSAEDLRLGVYVSAAGAEELERCGLTQPERTMTFHMAEGSTGTVSDNGVYDVAYHEENQVTLYVGSARNELSDYVRFGGEIFAVSHFTLSVFTNPDPAGTAARYPVLTPLASLESLTTEENGEVREYVLRDRKLTEEEKETETQTREVLLNGRLISWDAFEAAYDRLLTVTYSGRLPEGAAWKEPYKKYTFRTLSGGTHTIALSDWDGIHDAVTVDGATLFYLIRGGMTELPSEDR